MTHGLTTEERVSAIKVRLIMHGHPLAHAALLDTLEWTEVVLNAWEVQSTPWQDANILLALAEKVNEIHDRSLNPRPARHARHLPVDRPQARPLGNQQGQP